MTIQEQLEQLQNQQSSGNWFQDIVYNPFKSVYWDQTTIGGPEEIQDELSGMFPGFSESEWSRIDEATALKEKNINTQFNLWDITASNMKKFQDRKLDLESGQKIKKLEMQDEYSREKTNLDKKIMMDKALQSINQVDSLAGKTNLGSGTNAMNRKIAEDSIKTQVRSANLNRQFARKNVAKNKERIETNAENTKELAKLTYDAQYNTKMQDKDSKLSMLGLTSMIDKINVYEEWQASTIDRVVKLFEREFGYPDPSTDPGEVSDGSDQFEIVDDVGAYDPTPGVPDEQTVGDIICEWLPDWMC